jgi:hypothetical protein
MTIGALKSGCTYVKLMLPAQISRGCAHIVARSTVGLIGRNPYRRIGLGTASEVTMTIGAGTGVGGSIPGDA